LGHIRRARVRIQRLPPDGRGRPVRALPDGNGDGVMATLGELADVMRSKNAGPYQFTIDLMFNDRATYDRVMRSGVLSESVIAPLYGVDAALVRIMPFER